MTNSTNAINARMVANMTEEELNRLPQGRFDMVFDDGVMNVTKKSSIYTWYLWNLHRAHPEAPILMEHHLGDSPVTPNSHLDLLGKIRLSIIETELAIRSGSNANFDDSDINRLIYDAQNDLYNAMTHNLEAYITGISILDFMDIHYHPEIKKINDDLKADPYLQDIKIDEAHHKIMRVLQEDPTLLNNPVARAVKHKLVKPGQILQCVSARGYVTDVDNYRFPRPIPTGYVEGMRLYSEYATESRTATTAEYLTATPMQQSEYLNRLLQISTSVVKRIHTEDCGSTDYTVMVVDTMDKLKDLEGIHYFNKKGEERVVKKDAAKLLGKPLKIRTIFTCKHPDQYGVCAACYGDLAFNLVMTDNVGHTSAVELQADQSQLLMSHKHHTDSATGQAFSMSPEAKQYLERRVGYANNMFLKKFDKTQTKIVIYIDEGRNLDDLLHVPDLKGIAPERVASLENLGIILNKADEETREMVSVKSDTRNAHLTMEALHYIMKHGWETNLHGSYVIDMVDWDYNLPLLSLPSEQFSTVEYNAAIRRFVKGTGPIKPKPNTPKTIIHYDDIGLALSAFHDLVALKLNVNLSHLAVILYATRARNPDEGDYNLPPPDNREAGVFTKHNEKMNNSNIAAAMAYETQTNTVFSPQTYLYPDRPSHEFDHILMGGD